MDTALLRLITDQRRVGHPSFAAIVSLALINDQRRGVGTGFAPLVPRFAHIKAAITIEICSGQILEWLEDTGNRSTGNEMQMHVRPAHVARRRSQHGCLQTLAIAGADGLAAAAIIGLLGRGLVHAHQDIAIISAGFPGLVRREYQAAGAHFQLPRYAGFTAVFALAGRCGTGLRSSSVLPPWQKP